MTANVENEETGPLEATIKNLQREIDTKVRTHTGIRCNSK